MADAALGPGVEAELDAFSLVLPLPYRVAAIVALGVWAWGANVQGLHRLRIDVPSLIQYPARSNTTLHQPIYRLATLISSAFVVSIVLFWLVTLGRAEEVVQWEFLPNFYLLVLLLIIVLPIRLFSKNGRMHFLTALRRVSIGGIAQPGEGRFGDILLADVLTSYAKVLGDLFVCLCMLFSRRHSTSMPDRSCGGDFVVPILISVPYLIRFRQCLIEFFRVRKSLKSSASPDGAWGGQHLANAAKYASAFPVILLSALQRGTDPSSLGLSETSLYILWMIFALINSFFSFYWDVAKDWDLSLFSSYRARNSPEHPWGLRRYRYFGNYMYYTAILVDFVLRCTWSIKLSPHMAYYNDLEGGIFILELLEVARRWMWIFFRVETEWVRTNRGPAPDDILLGEYDGKYDED